MVRIDPAAAPLDVRLGSHGSRIGDRRARSNLLRVFCRAQTGQKRRARVCEARWRMWHGTKRGLAGALGTGYSAVVVLEKVPQKLEPSRLDRAGMLQQPEPRVRHQNTLSSLDINMLTDRMLRLSSALVTSRLPYMSPNFMPPHRVTVGHGGYAGAARLGSGVRGWIPVV